MARKKTTKREVAVAEPILEEVEDTKGLNIDGGIMIATFLLLCTALSVIWYLLDARYPAV
ncbi:MAG: hypothetical protein ACYTGW_14140 [Planctomycetota bacterium]|jgi:hypothetical protein